MTEFDEFIEDLLKDLGLGDKTKTIEGSPELYSKILSRLNAFLYQENGDYISKFHKFWEEYHLKILEPRIDDTRCTECAKVLEGIFSQHPVFVTADTKGLRPNQIANARLFTAVQDFKIRLKADPYTLVRKKPYLFDAKRMLDDFPTSINELLSELGALSQSDKRQKFARLCARLLVEKYDGDALNLCDKHNADALEIKKVLVENPDIQFKGQLGFSDKKANMFIRDMVDLGVWKLRNLESLDIASDANIMRIALRTGILKARFPLLASYLDVYCYQYGAIDEFTRKAWRRVWELWGHIQNNHRVSAPAFFDFFIFSLGRGYCRPRRKRCEECIFNTICEADTRMLNPPKSISIYGATGWESGRTDKGGGGGIMS